MQRLTKSRIHTHFDKSLPAVAEIESGEMAVVETLGTYDNKSRSFADCKIRRHSPKSVAKSNGEGNPITHSVYLQRAESSDPLVIEVTRVQLAP